jgi:hypothetical protein
MLSAVGGGDGATSTAANKRRRIYILFLVASPFAEGRLVNYLFVCKKITASHSHRFLVGRLGLG